MVSDKHEIALFVSRSRICHESETFTGEVSPMLGNRATPPETLA